MGIKTKIENPIELNKKGEEKRKKKLQSMHGGMHESTNYRI